MVHFGETGSAAADSAGLMSNISTCRLLVSGGFFTIPEFVSFERLKQED